MMYLAGHYQADGGEVPHFYWHITTSQDEQYLRDYYKLPNVSGTAHTPDQMAHTMEATK